MEAEPGQSGHFGGGGMSYYDDMMDEWLDSDMSMAFDDFAEDAENLVNNYKGNPKPACMSNKKPSRNYSKKACACGGHQGKRGKKKRRN